MSQSQAAILGRVALLGTGLIGGSLAAALKWHRLAGHIVGYSGADPADAAMALSLGLVDEIALTPEQAIAGCDTVVLAAPVSANAALLARIAPLLAKEVLLTDVSSVKMPVVSAALSHLGTVLAGYVPCHPIAGSERSGPLAADAKLFRKRTVILSPLAQTDEARVERLQAAWQKMGANVVRMTPQEHDRVYALVSHWPHALAFAMANAVDADAVADGLVGPGLMDLTRTAGSSPALWADILLENAEPVLMAADQVAAELAAIRGAIERRDRETLMKLFGKASAWRRRLG